MSLRRSPSRRTTARSTSRKTALHTKRCASISSAVCGQQQWEEARAEPPPDVRADAEQQPGSPPLVAHSSVWRSTSRACCRSAGYGLVISTRRPSAGCAKAKRPRMQPLSFQTKPFREHRVGPVGEVPRARVVQCGEVHPNLVGAAGFQLDVEQARGLVGFHCVVMGDAVPAALGDGELPVVTAMPADRRIDGAAGRIRMSLHQCVIALVDGALLECPLEHGVGTLGERHHHHARCADVQTVHDALPFVDARGGDPEARGGKPAEHRRPVPADRGVGGHTGGLVDRDDVVVGVQNRHALDVDRRVLRRRRRLPAVAPRARHPASGGRTCRPGCRRGRRRRLRRAPRRRCGTGRAAGPVRRRRACPPVLPGRASSGCPSGGFDLTPADGVGFARFVVWPTPPDGVEVETEQRQHNQQDRPAHHRRIGDVEHRPPADGQEVDDVPAQRVPASGRTGPPGCPSRRRGSCRGRSPTTATAAACPSR